jgi:hypothetical protein
LTPSAGRTSFRRWRQWHRGKSLEWFRSYLTSARQRVVWDGQVSDVVDVEYGVRQGSLLGPVLYLLHVSDLPLTQEIRESDGDSG